MRWSICYRRRPPTLIKVPALRKLRDYQQRGGVNFLQLVGGGQTYRYLSRSRHTLRDATRRRPYHAAWSLGAPAMAKPVALMHGLSRQYSRGA